MSGRGPREVLRMRLELQMMSDHDLAELVRKCAAAAAEAVITEGRDAQLAYLLLEDL